MSRPETLTDLAAFNHRHATSSVSTNSELIDALQLGSLATNTTHLLTADTQTSGRGQRGRSWQSPHGNVYLSLYHPIAIPVSGILSLIIGLELAKMPIIEQLNAQLIAANLTPIGVKWANDLGFYPPQTEQNSRDVQYKNTPLVNDFRKLAGILIEPVWHMSKLVGVVMGVGLNVQATPMLSATTSEGMSYQALSLQDIVTMIADKTSSKNSLETSAIMLPSLPEIYLQMSHALLAAMTCFHQLSAEQGLNDRPKTDSFLQAFAQKDALRGQYLRVSQNHNGTEESLYGRAAGIDTNGCLQLRQDNGKLAALFTGRIDVLYASDTP